MVVRSVGVGLEGGRGRFLKTEEVIGNYSEGFAVHFNRVPDDAQSHASVVSIDTSEF